MPAPDPQPPPAGRVKLTAPPPAGAEAILSPAALAFVVGLAQRFAAPLERLLARRADRRAAWAAGEPLDFDRQTREIREAPWTVAPAAADLERRIVEITGPVDRKMIINALNSGADVFMADFEDSCSPTWANVTLGQAYLHAAVRRTLGHDDPQTGKAYRLNERVATLMARPRGLHLPERHCQLEGRPVPAALFDFGLFFFHNALALVSAGSGPYLYLPKLESPLEARWWNEVFVAAEQALDLPRGTIRATVLIETLPAAFAMDEILYELREHSAGLNCGRWDYIFSFIKTRRHDPAAVLPDRAQVTMEQPCMRAYTQLVVRTCHRRGAHAIGGMAAQIPIRDDAAANRAALERVRADKLREVRDGHDGTWVAHPGLVGPAREAFTATMGDRPHQLGVGREDLVVGAADLLRVPEGTRTEAGLRHNARVAMRYLESWLSGNGCVPLDHLMEDAATAEISRAQVWQWLSHGAGLTGGARVERGLVERTIGEELCRIAGEVGPARFDGGRFLEARDLFAELCFAERLDEFLTLRAYEQLNTTHAA